MLQSVWGWVRKNVLGQNDDALFANVSCIALSMHTVVTDKCLFYWRGTQSRVIHVTSVEQFKELQQKSKDTKRSVRLSYDFNCIVLFMHYFVCSHASFIVSV